MTVCCPMCKDFLKCKKREIRRAGSGWEACCDRCGLFYTACPDVPILRRRGWFRINREAWRTNRPGPPLPPAPSITG